MTRVLLSRIKSPILFCFIGWWRARGFRITDREGNSFMGSQGTLTFVPVFFFPVNLPPFVNSVLISNWTHFYMAVGYEFWSYQI